MTPFAYLLGLLLLTFAVVALFVGTVLTGVPVLSWVVR